MTLADTLTKSTGPVAQFPATGRWFITMGQPGFNSPANNRDGYASEAAALAARDRYASKGART